MDCPTFSGPCEVLRCSASDAQRLTALLQDDGPRVGEDPDDLDHGFTLEHDALSGRLFVFAEDGQCNPAALPAAFCQALGEIAQRAGVEAVEFSVAQISTRFAANSLGGYLFRIQRDGRLVYPTLIWPSTTFSTTPAPSSNAKVIGSSDLHFVSALNPFDVALAAADPILATLDGALKQIQDWQALPSMAPAVREEALGLVIDRLNSVLEKVSQGGVDLSVDGCSSTTTQ